MLQEKNTISRKEKRLLRGLKKGASYLLALKIITKLFSPTKKFITASGKRVFGILSISIYKFLGYNVAFIDEFIVNKKKRGKGIGKKLFSQALSSAEKNNSDYVALITKEKRKASQAVYKKYGFTLLSFGVGIIAYKKLKKKKK